MHRGSCLCGNIAFEVNDAANSAVICYCTNCRKACSSYSLNMATQVDKVKLLKGAPKTYMDNECNSGKPMRRSFCGDCGSPVWSDPDSAPGVRYVKVGAMEDAKDFNLVAEVFVDQALPHQVIPKERCGQKHLNSFMKEVD